MSIEKFSTESIQEVFIEKNIQFPLDEFIEAIKQREKIKKEAIAAAEAAAYVAKAAEPETVEVDSDSILAAPDECDSVEMVIEDAVSNNDYHDLFYDRDGMDDEGADDTVYFKVGDKFYEVEIHCEAEWVGDWSVRKNLPGDVSVISIKELSTFKVVREEKDYISLEIPK